MNEITTDIPSSLGDMADTAVDLATDALGFAADHAGTALAMAAPFIDVIPSTKIGVARTGFRLLRRHPVLVVTGAVAVGGIWYWRSSRDDNDSTGTTANANDSGQSQHPRPDAD